MSLLPPEEKDRRLQETLQAKAKGSPGYRFYALYDSVRARTLAERTSGRPTGSWTITSGIGSASGCVPNRTSGVQGKHASPDQYLSQVLG